MKGAKEAAAWKLAASIRAIEFDVKIADTKSMFADVAATGVGGQARIEVRHPQVQRNGKRWLVAVIALESDVPEVVYAEPFYRPAIERAVARAGGVR